MRAALWIGAGLLATMVALFSYVLITDEGPPIIRRTVDGVRDTVFPTTDRPSIGESTATPPATTPVPTTRPAPTSPAADAPAPSTSSRRAAPPPAPAPAPVPATIGSTPAAPPAAPPRRTDYYVPGGAAQWTTLDVPRGVPLRLRAGGLLMAGEDSSGPEGIRDSAFERGLARRRSTGNARVLPSAPYLALLGRVCTGDSCSEPFVVGSARLVCPSDLAPAGRLQLWTNNYVQIDGTRTLTRFSTATGGYAVYAEPAPPAVCESGTTTVGAPDSAVIMAGQVLRRPEFTVSSSQTSWKPFFLPLNVPLLVRASGSMQPRGGARSTGPEGIVVPNQPRWVYPGTSDLVVDGQSRLYDARFPYQALIGRVCGASGCSQPFLVGTERAVCAGEGYTDRLELWINHIMQPEGLLGAELPVSMTAFELQGRRGEYRFEVSRAPAGACG